MTKMKIYVMVPLLISGLLIAGACKKSDSGDNNNNNNNNNNGQPTIGVRVGNIATNFTETDVQGGDFTLESLRGNVIILSFSTVWCYYCNLETPDLVTMYNTYKERGLEIVQCIYQDEDGTPADLSDLAEWIARYSIPFMVVNDTDESTVNTYKVRSIPHHVIIDREFIIRKIIVGADIEAIRAAVEELL